MKKIEVMLIKIGEWGFVAIGWLTGLVGFKRKYWTGGDENGQKYPDDKLKVAVHKLSKAMAMHTSSLPTAREAADNLGNAFKRIRKANKTISQAFMGKK